MAFMGLDITKDVAAPTYYSDNIGYTEDLLESPLGHKMREKGITVIRKYSDKKYHEMNPEEPNFCVTWQVNFGTSDPKEAEKLAREQFVSSDSL